MKKGHDAHLPAVSSRGTGRATTETEAAFTCGRGRLVRARRRQMVRHHEKGRRLIAEMDGLGRYALNSFSNS